MRQVRAYSDEQKAAALACLDAHDGNFANAARAAGVPESSLRSWAKRPETDRSVILRGQKRQELDEMLEQIVRRSLKIVKQKAKMESASYSQLMVGIGIGLDKIQNLRSKPLPPAPREVFTGINLADLSDNALEQIQAILASEGQRLQRLPSPEAG